MEITTDLIEEFILMFPNCPDPVHQPRQVMAMWQMFLHIKELV
jgi:hypothetical protein